MPESIDVHAQLSVMAERLQRYLQTRNINDPVLVGIRTGGVWLAEKLHKQLGVESALGILDISFYRDDFTRVGMNPKVMPSNLPFTTEDRHVVLIDDVIMSGRTIRAALNELFDYGRPASVTLVALLDLEAHELPIRADVVGMTLTLAPGQQIKLCGPDPLHLTLEQRKP